MSGFRLAGLGRGAGGGRPGRLCGPGRGRPRPAGGDAVAEHPELAGRLAAFLRAPTGRTRRGEARASTERPRAEVTGIASSLFRPAFRIRPKALVGIRNDKGPAEIRRGLIWCLLPPYGLFGGSLPASLARFIRRPSCPSEWCPAPTAVRSPSAGQVPTTPDEQSHRRGQGPAALGRRVGSRAEPSRREPRGVRTAGRRRGRPLRGHLGPEVGRQQTIHVVPRRFGCGRWCSWDGRGSLGRQASARRRRAGRAACGRPWH